MSYLMPRAGLLTIDWTRDSKLDGYVRRNMIAWEAQMAVWKWKLAMHHDHDVEKSLRSDGSRQDRCG